MKNTTVVALVAGGATIIAAVIAISPKFLPNDEVSDDRSGNSISIDGSSTAPIVQGSEKVTINQSFETRKEESAVKIVSSTAEQNKLDVSVIDLKLRNTGDNSAFLKDLSLVNIEWVVLKQCSHCPGARVFATERYDITLRDLKPKQISQAIPPRGVDRFLVAVQGDFFSNFAIYKSKIKLTYDEDNKVVESSPFFLTFGPKNWSLPSSHSSSCISEIEWQECTTENKKRLKTIGYSVD